MFLLLEGGEDADRPKCYTGAKVRTSKLNNFSMQPL